MVSSDQVIIETLKNGKEPVFFCRDSEIKKATLDRNKGGVMEFRVGSNICARMLDKNAVVFLLVFDKSEITEIADRMLEVEEEEMEYEEDES